MTAKTLQREGTDFFDCIPLYLHIPKTAGSTLCECILSQCCAPEWYKEEGNYLQAGVYYYPKGFLDPSQASLPETITRVLYRPDLRAVVGHFCFGIHEYIRKPAAYVTVLRNPVERVVSYFHHFQHWRSSDQPYLGDMSLEDTLLSGKYDELYNGQTRRIAGLGLDDDRHSPAVLDVAKENLRKHFAVVGVTERFDETILLISRTFRWKKRLRYLPRLVNKN